MQTEIIWFLVAINAFAWLCLCCTHSHKHLETRTVMIRNFYAQTSVWASH